MSNRITDANLKGVCDIINRITNSPSEAYLDGKAQIGNHHISHSYGGVCVHRMHNEGGGVSTPIISYHTTKRELYDAMHAWIRGFEAGRIFKAETVEA